MTPEHIIGAFAAVITALFLYVIIDAIRRMNRDNRRAAAAEAEYQRWLRNHPWYWGKEL